MSTANHLYHFTSSAQLPRIVRSGVLRPAVYVGQPRDFVHATDDENGDRTAAGWWTWDKAYRAGTIRRVRITLAARDFEPWLTVVARYPDWTPDWITRLQEVARKQGQSASGWYCRPDPLPLAKAIAIDTRSYTGHRWEPFDLSSAVVLEPKTAKPTPDADTLGIKLGDKIYWSTREARSDGHDAYGDFLAAHAEQGLSVRSHTGSEAPIGPRHGGSLSKPCQARRDGRW